MSCYLITDGGLLPGSLIMEKTCTKQIGPPCTAGKFKLAVLTVPTNALACAVICDPCQPTKFKGYLRVFIYVGAGYLIHNFHA